MHLAGEAEPDDVVAGGRRDLGERAARRFPPLAGSCSVQPGRGVSSSCGRVASATSRPSVVTARARVPLVPTSTPISVAMPARSLRKLRAACVQSSCTHNYMCYNAGMKLAGLHHITMITGDAQENVRFYADLLGLRFVKKTVNFDAPRRTTSTSATSRARRARSSPGSSSPARPAAAPASG